jgi:uncharacterized protein YwlG (UPF0340 family)
MKKKKLSKREMESKKVEVIVKEIEKLAYKHGVMFARFACQRYNKRITEELKLKREILEREKELEMMKRKRQ